MNLHCVTITGADESVKVDDLVRLSEEFPFVEWGILFSTSRIGTPRYPGLPWVQGLACAARTYSTALSAHLCGQYRRDALNANWSWQRAIGDAHWFFGRVQINCSADPSPLSQMLHKWPSEQRIIVQCGEKNRHRVIEAVDYEYRLDVLFDSSGGRGELPRAWPFALERVLCGYAGGLGPDNVAQELETIGAVAREQSFWIDMERRVRSEDDTQFDLGKVRAVLEACEPFFKPISVPKDSAREAR